MAAGTTYGLNFPFRNSKRGDYLELTQFEDTTYTSTSSRNAVTNMYVRLIDLYPLNLQSMPSNWADEGYHKVNCSFYFRDIEIV